MNCMHCETAVSPDDRFCPGCKRPLPGRRVSGEAKVQTSPVDTSLIAELEAEKEKLDRKLKELQGIAEYRALTPDERAEWSRCQPLWLRVRKALTREMQYIEARADNDRRSGERRSPAGDDTYSGPERRSGERRSGEDRRDPFPKEI